MQEVGLNSIVRMRKAHPCGENRWKVIRYGADVKLQCLRCDRIVMLERPKFKKNLKEVLAKEQE